MGEVPTILENRVRFAETDMQEVVFYGHYVVYQDETFNEFLRRVGYDYREFHDAGRYPHVVNLDVDFRGSATFGDVIENGMRVARFGDSSFTLEYAARRKGDDTTLVEGTLTYVVVDAETGDPVRVPEGFREAVREFQDRAPTGA